MINHLTERTITGLWFGIMGFLIIPFFVFSYHLTLIQALSSALVSCLAICLGFFFGYKNLLEPANQLSPFITRPVAAAWIGCIGFILAEIIININTPNTHSLLKVTLTTMLTPIIFFTVFAVFGFIYCHKLLSLPNVIYIKSLPSLKERTIAMLWFGLIGTLIQYFFMFFHGITNPNSLFVITFVSYIGFSYGFRILLLPTSIKAAIKSIMLGFIGCSFTLLLVHSLFFLTMIFSTPLPDMNQVPVISPIVDSILEDIGMEVIIFTITAVFACIPAMIFTFIFYLLAITVRMMFPHRQASN